MMMGAKGRWLKKGSRIGTIASTGWGDRSGGNGYTSDCFSTGRRFPKPRDRAAGFGNAGDLNYRGGLELGGGEYGHDSQRTGNFSCTVC